MKIRIIPYRGETVFWRIRGFPGTVLEDASRLRDLGGVQLSVAGSSLSANILYASMLGMEHRKVVPWTGVRP